MGQLKVDLAGETALVTGAGKGIGRAIALALAQAGADVAAVSRTAQDLEKVQKEIEKEGSNCFTRPCDITSVSQIYQMVEDVFAWQGKIDILVNCAGLNIPVKALDVTEEQWDTILDTNLKGAFFVSQAVAHKMIPRKTGKIVNITSEMAFVGYYDRAAYCASKGGLTLLTKVLAVEWGPYNIKANCVAPTFIKTALTEPMFANKDFYEDVIQRSPLGKIGHPEDVVGAVLYLVSDAAALVTGSSILVDGGWVAW